MSDELSHTDASGAARMVDVTAKGVTSRSATATGHVQITPYVAELLHGDGVPKGDALGVARVAGIMAAKRTPDLVPLCHPLAIGAVTVDIDVVDDSVRGAAVVITSTVKTAERTGVEMEALTSVSVAALTVVDMVKAVDKAARIAGIEVVAKSGGSSGDWRRDSDQ